jgi:clostripain
MHHPTTFAATAWLALAAALPALAQAPPDAAEQRPWTFLIYGACDNNAETDGNFFRFLDGVRGAFADDPGVEIVLFLDRSEGYSTNASSLGEDFTDARLYRVRSGRCERLAGGAEFPEITLDGTYEPDSADPVNVRKLLAFGKARFPAQRYVLMLYGHADGRAMCPDEQSEHEMGFAQLTDAVPAELSVDLMALELCNMGGLEIAYQWRPGNGGFSTRHLVAIPNAGPALEWDRVFARLRSPGSGASASGEAAVDPAALGSAAFGELIVEEGGRGRELRGQHHEAVACYDLDGAAAVKTALDALAVALAAGDTKAMVEEVRGPGADGCTLNYGRDRLERAPFVDVYDLAVRLSQCEALDAAARDAAKAVAAATDEFVLASYGGEALPRFAPGRTGVYLTFPPGDQMVTRRDQSAQLWSLCRWYSPLPVPGVYGRLAFCRDGATAGNGVVESWFELLDCWYDPAAPEPGANRCAH